MEKDMFNEVGKRMPYIMPQGFDANALMANAIAVNRKRQSQRRWMWGGGAVAAAASVAILLGVSLFMAPDPVSDYNNALADYLESASESEMEYRESIADADLVNCMDTYQEYYLN